MLRRSAPPGCARCCPACRPACPAPEPGARGPQGINRLGLVFQQLVIASLAVSTVTTLEAAAKWPDLVWIASALFFGVAGAPPGLPVAVVGGRCECLAGSQI